MTGAWAALPILQNGCCGLGGLRLLHLRAWRILLRSAGLTCGHSTISGTTGGLEESDEDVAPKIGLCENCNQTATDSNGVVTLVLWVADYDDWPRGRVFTILIVIPLVVSVVISVLILLATAVAVLVVAVLSIVFLLLTSAIFSVIIILGFLAV